MSDLVYESQTYMKLKVVKWWKKSKFSENKVIQVREKKSNFSES